MKRAVCLVVLFTCSEFLNAELRCHVTSRAHGPLLDTRAKETAAGLVVAGVFSTFNQEYLVVVRDSRMVERFYPNLNTALEFDTKSDIYTQIDYPAKIYSTTPLADYIRAVDQTVYSRFLPPSGTRKSETQFVATEETRSIMGMAASRYIFEGRIPITVVRGGNVDTKKPSPASANAGTLDATAVICGSSWLAAPLPGYQLFQNYGRQYLQKLTALSHAPFRAAFLQHGGFDVFDVLNSAAPNDEVGMPLANSGTMRIVFGSVAKACTEGESLVEIDVSYLWFDEPESKEDPFSSPAVLATFNQIPSVTSLVTSQPASIKPLREDDDGRPTLRRPDDQEKDERPTLKRRSPKTKTLPKATE